MLFRIRPGFWRDAFALNASIAPYVAPNVFLFGLIGIGIWLVTELVEWLFRLRIVLEVAPYEVAGGRWACCWCSGRTRIRPLVGGPEALGGHRQPDPEPDPGVLATGPTTLAGKRAS